MEILNPVSPRREGTIDPAARLQGFAGAAIGLLHNGKPGGAEILEGIRQALSTRFEGVRFEYRRKRHASSGAEFLPMLFGKWQAAVVALGD